MRKELASQEEKKVVDLYNSGLGSVEIAQRFDCSDQTIRRYLHKNKIKLRSRSKVTYSIVKEFIKLYKKWQRSKAEMSELIPKIYRLQKAGLEPVSISKKLKISPTIVYRYIEKFKVNDSEERVEFLGVK